MSDALRSAIRVKDYEYDALGVELDNRYRSAAVLADGTDEPAYSRDADLHHAPPTWPGARLPHARLKKVGELRRGRSGVASRSRSCSPPCSTRPPSWWP